MCTLILAKVMLSMKSDSQYNYPITLHVCLAEISKTNLEISLAAAVVHLRYSICACLTISSVTLKADQAHRDPSYPNETVSPGQCVILVPATKSSRGLPRCTY